MAAKLTRRKHFGFALESTSGTAETIAAPDANAVAYEPKMSPQEFFSGGERMPSGGSSGALPPTRGMTPGQFTCTLDVSHTSSLFETMLQACGFVLSGSTLTPSIDPADHQSATIVLWEGGRRKQLRGACGTCSLEFSREANKIVASFTFTGIYDAVTDVALPSDPSSLDTPYRFLGGAFTLGGSAVQLVDTISLDLGADVQVREDASDDTGIAHYFIADINPTMTLPTEAVDVATEDAYGKLLAGTAEALSLSCDDPADNTIAFTSPKAMRTAIADEDRNGKLVDGLTLGLYTDSGDDQLSIEKTDAV